MMTTPIASRTTISSRNKVVQLSEDQPVSLGCKNNRNNMPPPPAPSLIARNRAIKTLAPQVNSLTSATKPTFTPAPSRLARLANGFSNSMRDGPDRQLQPNDQDNNNKHPYATITNHTTSKLRQSSRTLTRENSESPTSFHPGQHRQKQPSTTRSHPHTTVKLATTKPGIPPTTTRLMAPQSKSSSIAPLNSRSSSVLSSVSSSVTASKRPSAVAGFLNNEGRQSGFPVATNHIPDTNSVRKGLAKFSNPIECQRQVQALSLKIRQRDEMVEAREKEIDELQARLNQAVKIGSGYATIVQYFAAKLKFDCKVDILTECDQLKFKVDELMVNEREYENKLESIVDDYKNHLKVELDLRKSLENDIERMQNEHDELVQKLEETHKSELDDLNEKHSIVEQELQGRITTLETELNTKTRDLIDLRKEYESLTSSFNKLEESLTKDKDARVKYAQEKISQLQKDVESLNSVLEMRLERIHTLEKDSILLAEVRNDLISQKDINKALNQQLESLNAALDKKREQYETLIMEHEGVCQDLKRERKERRRITMKTEQLEYVLNESCASESNIVFNPNIRDLDSSDHLV